MVSPHIPYISIIGVHGDINSLIFFRSLNKTYILSPMESFSIFCSILLFEGAFAEINCIRIQ